MKIENPDYYFGKKIRVYSADGTFVDGNLYGYDYDYDDNDNEFIEIDVQNNSGMLIGFSEAEIDRIEIIDN